MDSALVHYKQSVAIRDSIFNAERSEQIAEMREKYESGKKDAELLENQANLEQRALTIKAVAVGAPFFYLQECSPTALTVSRNAQVMNWKEERDHRCPTEGEGTAFARDPSPR